MRRLIGVALAVGTVLGCASIAPPPGGPEDKVPPQLLSIEPESGAVNAHPKNVTFHFDDVINEQAGGTGGLASFFLISPMNGDVDVGWHRSTIDVRPKHGFRANTAYTVTMLPGITDLRGNARKDGVSLVFSTGATIPSTEIAGTIFDWVEGKPLIGADVRALAQPDTQLVYVAQSDSLGRFSLPHVTPGTYLVRGFADQNHDHTLDPRDAWDTVRVTLRDTSHVEILAFVHDTLGPSITTLAQRDSVTLQVTFDRGIDPAQTIDVGLFHLKAADSSLVPIQRAVPVPEWEKTHAAQAHADSLARADSAARADSLKAAQAGVRRVARDTTKAAPAPTPSRPSPITSVVLELGRSLQPEKSYRLTVVGLRGLTGASHTTARVIDVPKALPPAATAPDSGKAGAPTSKPGAPPTKPGAPPAKPGAKTPAPAAPTKPAPTKPATKAPPARPPTDTSRTGAP
ncbi:MAG TPA: Ig-like domain-containing protein [Gemmatimonadaceae bacterium]|nr:Ig-like domain-containing protein [Gemmatimonadaceae bacterium]